ncbi:sigma-70 family RNA polymerase sigma factor [Streptomyces malaysiense]|uniref:RNA polymerase sigma factor n=1 Tax=Streptomyces malaysiense TaxID=1428626 RepID=A0A1J4Q1R3_9ACTN|nr:sigma-70 family RNA polymerase sigma factor [Streptomyces malaysiense]OIK26095.1 RNA polymerase [Streptomyces malaysiense]
MSTRHTDAAETAALVIAAREGDAAAQDALVSAYLPLVYNIVGRALNGSVDVDDVVQETMLRALDGLGGLRAPERFRSWLVAIAMNQVRDHWQDRRSVPAAVEEAHDLADPGADFVDLTVVQLQLSGQRQETAHATRWLEPDDRGLLSLWWLECAGELTRAEVAAALELTPEHTAVRVQRMKAQLEAARVVVRALDARPRCEELRGVLAAWDGKPSALWRKRIARHARGCPLCSGLWSGLMPAEGLLAGLALVAAAPALLAALRSASGGMAPVAAASPFDPPAGSGGSGAGTGSVSGSGGGRRAARGRSGGRGASRRRRRMRRRVVAGVVVACVAGGGLWYFGVDARSGSGDTAADRSADASAVDLSAPSAVPTSASPSPSASKSEKPRKPKKKATRSPSPTPTPTRKSTPSPRPSTPRAPVRTTAPAPAGDTVSQVVALVNQQRASAGCSPLTEDPQLQQAAQAHSDDMAARNFFDHVNPDGVDPGQRITAAGYRWSTYGENIAMGQQTPASVMDAWMNSPGHRANILNCAFKNIGVGVHKGTGGPWWTQDFGTRM